jgi:hypothetical protein
MELAGFVERFNKRAEEIGHQVRIEKVMTEDSHASSLYCGSEVSIVAGERDNVTNCQVICGMQPDQSPLGLSAFATVLDVLTGCSSEVRKGWLERLGLFNGKVAKAGAAGTTTKARDYVLEIRPHNPGRNLMSWIIKPQKLLKNSRRSVANEDVHDRLLLTW